MPSHDLRRKLIGAIVPLFAVAHAACAADATSLAMVTDVRGTVVLRSEPKTPAVAILQELTAGARLRLDRGERASLVYLDSGQAYELAGPAEVRLDAGGPVAVRGAEPSARGPALAGEPVRIEPVKVTQAALAMRTLGEGPRLQLASLAGTATLESPPVFRWIAPANGRAFKVVLLDDRGRQLWSGDGEGNSVALPDGVVLDEAKPYTWLVSMTDADGRLHSNAGEFTVAPAALRARAEAMRPAADAAVSARVVYATWLEQNDLRDAARPWWQALAAELRDQPRLRVLSGE